MSKFKDGQAALDIDFLQVASRTRLVESALYSAFMKNLFDGRSAFLRGQHDAALMNRLADIDKLLTQRPDHTELLFAKTMFGSLEHVQDQLKFLAGNAEEHFAWLQEN